MLLKHHDVPLPPCPHSFAEIPILRDAYERVLRLEVRDSAPVWARILGYMLLESSFDPESQMRLAKEILSAVDDEALEDLGRDYKNSFLLACGWLSWRLSLPDRFCFDSR